MAAMVASVALMLGSCIKAEDVTIKELENVSMEGMSRLNLMFKIENRSGSKITLRDAKFSIKQGSSKVVDVMLNEPVVLARRSMESVYVPLRVKLSNPLAAIALVRNVGRNPNSITINGEFTVKAGWMRKKIVLTDVPISQIMTNFGVDIKQIIESI